MKPRFLKRVLFFVGILWATAVMATPAAILLVDTFNCENGGQGAFEYDNFENWNVTNGNIALIGNGFFDIYPGNGLSLDLGGSDTKTPGTLTSKKTFTLNPDTAYVLSFDLGGNPFNPSLSDTVRVSLGSAYNEAFTLENTDPLQKFTRTIRVDSKTTGTLNFKDEGSLGVDSEGLILDNVSLIAVQEGCDGCSVATVSATPNLLWPPNHKMRPVKVRFTKSENCNEPLGCKITSVTSNEPENGLGDGDTAPDWVITGDLTVNLRAERSGTGTGRVYTITLTCTDTFGTSSTGAVDVAVPHDKGKKK
jgi:hypothetical protein